MLYSILFNLFDCYNTMKYLSILMFAGLGLLFFVSSLYSLSEIDASEFVYDYIEGDEYYMTTHFVSFHENYTFIDIDGDLKFIVAEDEDGLPIFVNDSSEIYDILFDYYLTELNISLDSSSELVDAQDLMQDFYDSIDSGTSYMMCDRYLGTYKLPCTELEECRYCCYHSLTCKPMALGLRWEFLGAMLNYTQAHSNLSMFENQSIVMFSNATTQYNSNDIDELIDFVDENNIVATGIRDNPIIDRWRFCSPPDFDIGILSQVKIKLDNVKENNQYLSNLNNSASEIAEFTNERIQLYYHVVNIKIVDRTLNIGNAQLKIFTVMIKDD